MILQPDLWRQIVDRIVARRAQDAEKIVGGSCKTMEAYAEHVGYVRALDWVLQTADEINNPPPEPEHEDADA